MNPRWAAAFALCLFVSVIIPVEPARASNEGFFLPKRIYPLGSRPVGWNLVALPARNPYQAEGGLTILCRDLNLDAQAQIVQIDGRGGINTYNCGSPAPQWSPIPGVGVIVLEPSLRDGRIVGSDDVAKSLTIFNAGAFPGGTTLFPVDYHTIDVTPEDLCQDCGLSVTATVSRIDAPTGMVMTHQCGQIPTWSLVTGEAVIIMENQGTRTCRPTHL